MYCKYCGKEMTESHFNNGVCSACMTRMANEHAQQQKTDYTQAEPVSHEQKNIAPKVEIPPVEQMSYTPVEQTYHAPEEQKNPRMLGFKKALAGTIIGYVGFIIVVIVYFFAAMGASAGMYDTEVFIGAAAFGSLLIVPAVVGTILPLVFGINSIKTFRKATGPKPIATLILGINSVYFAGMSVIFLMFSFIFIFFGMLML